MFSATLSSASVRLRAACALLLPLGLLLAGGAGAARAEGEAPRFVREGLWLPAETAPQEARVNGRAAAVLRLPGGRGALLEAPWYPGERIVARWRAGGAERRAEAVAPPAPEALVWLSRPWPPGALLAEEDTVTALAFSADGGRLAAGTQQGRLAVFDLAAGEIAWSANRPGRVIKHLLFDDAGRRLYVGEQGPEGRVAGYDPSAGSEPLWTFDGADVLGTSPPEEPGRYGWVSYPGAYRLAAEGADVLAALSRSWSENGVRRARAVLVRLDGASGRVRWRYPAGEPFPAVITWFDAADGRAVLATQLPHGARSDSAADPAADSRSRLRVLELAAGRETLAEPVAPLAPYPVARFWRGLALRPGGEAFAAASEDGRAWIYRRAETGWRIAWQQALVEPIRLGTVTLTAAQGTLAATSAQVLVATGPTYAPQEYGGTGEPAASHPRSNTVFAFDWSGKPLWIWRMDNDLQGLLCDGPGRWAVLALGGEQPQPPGRFQGLVLLRTEPDAERGPGSVRGPGRVAFRFALSGAVAYGALAMTRDGRWLALAETPRAVAGDARRPGERRIWVLR